MCLTRIGSLASKLEQVCAQANSASYPKRSGVSASSNADQILRVTYEDQVERITY